MNLNCSNLVVVLLAIGSLAHAASGILELDSKPGGAEVFVDGKKKGTTPETEGQKLTMELAEGDHEVVIKKEGTGSATKKVFIGEGVIQPLTLTIMPEAFTNLLGMKFVPVPGTQILMCIHETRKKDYMAYAAENRAVDMSWKDTSVELSSGKFALEPDTACPVVRVSWEDAQAFCGWLSKKDGRTYRLPTDHEWSFAVGIGEQENERDTPEAKDGKVPGFPWGAGYPPPKNNVGNYWDATAFSKSNHDGKEFLGTYDDGHLFTSPVMSYRANKLGIYDLGGNVWEWCLDIYQKGENYRVLRGGSWGSHAPDDLASSGRSYETPDFRHSRENGFRCVVVAGGSSH